MYRSFGLRICRGVVRAFYLAGNGWRDGWWLLRRID
jgi:hypothetical protein